MTAASCNGELCIGGTVIALTIAVVAGWEARLGGAGAPWRGLGAQRVALPSPVAVAVALLLAALSSRPSDWESLSLVLALGALAVGAEAATIGARSVRVSSGLAVAVPIMALLGPAPAVAIAIASLAVESVINRISWRATLSNAVIFYRANGRSSGGRSCRGDG
jgi:hypothetical protein